MSKRYDLLLRLLLVGDSGVGKTCLICRYAQDEFIESHITTIGVDFKMKTATIDNKTVKMQIWDTAGQERFEAITKQFYRRAQGVILVFDISNLSSFESLAKWLHFVRQLSHPDTCAILLGNKCDQEERRQVSTDVAQRFAAENNLKYYETSAKHPENIDQPFLELCKQILDVQKAEGELYSRFNANNSHEVSLENVTVQREDNADAKLEKGARDLPTEKRGCCRIS